MNLLQKAQSSGATIFIYIVGLLFAAVVAYQIILHQQIDAIALSILYGVITTAVNAAGTKAGVDHTNNTVEHVAIAQYPLTSGGISAASATAEAAKTENDNMLSKGETKI